MAPCVTKAFAFASLMVDSIRVAVLQPFKIEHKQGSSVCKGQTTVLTGVFFILCEERLKSVLF